MIYINGKSYKKCKVVTLPTEKVNKGQRYISKCIKSFDLGYIDDFHNANNEGSISYSFPVIEGEHKDWEKEHYQQQHLYILSDEKIKAGDWVYDTIIKQIFSVSTINQNFIECKKIISSTDKSLGLPETPETFIKKYCEIGGIDDEVLVKHWDTIGSLSYNGERYKVQLAPDNTIIIKEINETYTKS